MKTFAVIHEHMGELEREIVSDCKTVADYVNRKFGRSEKEIAENGLSVTDVTEGNPTAPAAATAAVAPAAPVTSAEPSDTSKATDAKPAK